MATAKPFPLAAVLTVTTGRLLCPIDEMYAILSHLAGEDVYTHQWPRAMDACRPWLLRWFPALGNVAMDALDDFITRDGHEAGCQAWLEALRTAGYSALLHVPPLPPGAYDAQESPDGVGGDVGERPRHCGAAG